MEANLVRDWPFPCLINNLLQIIMYTTRSNTFQKQMAVAVMGTVLCFGIAFSMIPRAAHAETDFNTSSVDVASMVQQLQQLMGILIVLQEQVQALTVNPFPDEGIDLNGPTDDPTPSPFPDEDIDLNGPEDSDPVQNPFPDEGIDLNGPEDSDPVQNPFPDEGIDLNGIESILNSWLENLQSDSQGR